MKLNRRSFLAGATGLGGIGLAAGAEDERKPDKTPRSSPRVEELDRAAAAPVLRLDGLKSPVIIDSIKLLKKDREYFVHVRSKDGADGLSLTNPPRAQYLDKILKQLVIPFFIGKDARDLDNLLWELYRFKDTYKLQGLALWSPHAWVEFAILDMLGRVARKPMGALIGDITRQEVAIYVASGRRDTTPEQEIENLRKLLEQSGAK
ncbi:MAG: mandelate racemase/muconate lactonizing enzyme family protein, partial [Gammaproteobacteria bacterium]